MLLLAGAAGCYLQPELAPVAAETAHFRYRIDPGLPMCGAAVAWLEPYHDAVTGWLGVADPETHKLDFSYVTAGRLTTICGSGTGGCAQDGRAFAGVPFFGHELVHLYAERLGHPPALLREGLAEVLGDGWTDTGPMERGSEVRDLLEEAAFRAAPDQARAYRLAAGFVRLLVDRYGREPFLDFYAAVPADASAARFANDFEDFFGEPMEDAFTAWMQGPPPTAAQIALHLAECQAPPIGAEPVSMDLGCGLGADGDERVAIRSLSLDRPAGVTLGVTAGGAVTVEAFSCATGARMGAGAITGQGTVDLGPRLDAGRYWVRVRAAGSAEPDGAPMPLALAVSVHPHGGGH